MTRRHVVPHGDKWAVKAPGATKVSVVKKTQAQAEAAARAIVKNQGGGEVTVHRPNGKIRDSDTIAPGNDPNPPRDAKH